jgi:hypothetical protein
MDAARQPAGIPTGGQFAATAHAEPDVTLETAADIRQPYHPDRHALLLTQADRRLHAVDKMLKEQDRLSMEAAKSGILRDYPTATEMRVKQHFGDRGSQFRSTLEGIRDKDGNNLAAGVSNWDYKPAPDGGRSISNSFHEIRNRFFDYENDFAYDTETGEIIVPLDRDYAEGIDLM